MLRTLLLCSLLFVAPMALPACGSSGGGGGTSTANAGVDQNVNEGAAVVLSGSASGAVLAVEWAQTSGPSVVLAGATTHSASFTAPQVPIGTSSNLVFSFTVTAQGGFTTVDTVTVVVTSADFLVFRADVTAGDLELWRVGVEPGSPPPVRLNGPLVASGDVLNFALSPDGTRVVYAADQDTNDVVELYVANTDGSGSPVKVNGPLVAGGDVSPAPTFGYAWAPDGSRLAYLADQDVDGDSELYSVRPDGTGLVQLSGALPVDGDVAVFFWAPDASRVAYVADQDTDGVFELYSSLAAGGGNVKLNGPLVLNGDVSASISATAWSPDSARVAYLADQDVDGTLELYSSLATGGGTMKHSGALVAGGDVSTPVFWAPDGSRLSYRADQDTDNVLELYTSLAVGGGNVKVGTAQSALTSYAWAPDGSRIAYISDRDAAGDQELFTVLPDGAGTVQLNGALVAGGDVSAFEWAPDASRIAYRADQDTNDVAEIYTVLAGGGGRVKLNGPLVVNGDATLDTLPPAWAPDSSRVAYEADQVLDDRVEIFTSLAAGGGNTVINGPLVLNGDATERAWSPDASHLAYIGDQDTDGVIELYIRPGDGSGASMKVSHAVPAGSVQLPFEWRP